MAGAKITFDYSLDEFQRNAEELAKKSHQELKDVILRLTGTYANALARFTWPDRGKRTLARKRYTRPIDDLKHPKFGFSEIDAFQLRAGRRWKVIYSKAHPRRKDQAVYFASKAEAMQAAVIKNRGLARRNVGKKLELHWCSTTWGHKQHIE